MIRAEVLISELDRELASYQQAIATARCRMARQTMSTRSPTCARSPGSCSRIVPAEVDRLYNLAIAARPELHGRLAAIARDEKAEQLARKRASQRHARPDLHGHVEDKTPSPRRPVARQISACSSRFNLPVNQGKYRSRGLRGPGTYHRRHQAVRGPAATRAYSEIQDLLAQARVQQKCSTCSDRSCPGPRNDLELAKNDYARGTSISRRSSRPFGRSFRSRCRLPRSRPSSVRPWRLGTCRGLPPQRAPNPSRTRRRSRSGPSG